VPSSCALLGRFAVAALHRFCYYDNIALRILAIGAHDSIAVNKKCQRVHFCTRCMHGLTLWWLGPTVMSLTHQQSHCTSSRVSTEKDDRSWVYHLTCNSASYPQWDGKRALAKRQCSATRKVTAGLTMHWPCVALLYIQLEAQ